MFLATITPFGYAFLGLIILSVFVSYKWLKKDKNEKPGCFSLGLSSLIVFCVLMFPLSFSIGFYESGNQPVKIAIIAFWILLIGGYFFAKIFKKTDSFWKIIWTILKYIFGAIFLGLFCVLYFGMFYVVYQMIFTDNDKDLPLWAGFIGVFFSAVLTLIVFSIPLSKKLFKGESTFYDLTKALKKPNDVTRLDLSQQNLVQFPTEILQMFNIQYLDLSLNSIKDVPLEIKKLSKLEDLYLKNNPIPVVDKVRMRKEFSVINIQF